MRISSFALAAVAAALALPPAASAAGSCVPAGATALGSASPHQLYRFLRGPITACDGTRPPVELGGWEDDTKPPLAWPRTTRVSALQGDCAALSDFDASAYGGAGVVTAYNLKTGTSWQLDTYVANQFGQVSIRPPSFSADCSATWTVTEQVGKTVMRHDEALAAPADAAPLPAHPGVRPVPRRTPTLSRRTGRVRVRVTLNREARGLTVVVGGKRVAVAHPPQTTSVALSASASRGFVRGKSYRVVVTACDDGCATSTYRVPLR